MMSVEITADIPAEAETRALMITAEVWSSRAEILRITATPGEKLLNWQRILATLNNANQYATAKVRHFLPQFGGRIQVRRRRASVRISLAEVQAVFDGLLAGESRESASVWAVERMQANDAGCLIYDPTSAEDRIWDALTFLAGVDMITDMAGSYLYGSPDFERYRP